MANNTNGRPVAEIRVGRITATIWQNTPTDAGVFYSVHITRLFRRGSTWDRTPAFGRDDLLTVAKVADLANTRIYSRSVNSMVSCTRPTCPAPVTSNSSGCVQNRYFDSSWNRNRTRQNEVVLVSPQGSWTVV